MKKNRYYLMLIVVMATTILGQIYMKPFGTEFRVSVGIVVLSVLLLRFDKLPIISTCILTGISIFSFRFMLDAFPNTQHFSTIFFSHIPSLAFYAAFGVLLNILHVRENVSKPVVCILIIALSDVGANVFELGLRGDYTSVAPEVMSISIVFTALIRAMMAYLLYLSEKLYAFIIVDQEQRAKYREFVMLRANIKSEIFFMQKSMDDIEHSMKESYSLYRQLNQEDLSLEQDDIVVMKNKILGISKGIHEIKKDYARIIAGMGNVIPDVEYTKFKSSEEIFEILQSVTDKYILKTRKNIKFSIEINEHFPIFYYSPLLSVLNNLIVNAIDAIMDEGLLTIRVVNQEEYIDIYVIDNGKGIKEKHLSTIFNPGFSTKFDKSTGKMSTGIGLTHVKHIVERSLDGSIDVESKINIYTQFHMTLPKLVLCEGGHLE